MSAALLIEQLINGLIAGSMYALLGAGIALIYGTLRILNFAHGEFFMLGGFGVFILMVEMGLPALPAGLLAVALVFLFAMASHVAVIKPLLGREGWEFSTIAVTLGISVALQNVALLLWGEKFQTVPYFAEGSVSLLGYSLPWQRLLILLVALVTIGGMTLVLKYSRLGKAIRATAQEPNAAAVVGVPTGLIHCLTFAIGCALAAVAAVMLAPIYAVNPWMGVPQVFKGFVVVILGGLGSFPGAIAAGFLLGIVEALGVAFTSSEWRDVIAFGVVILVIWLRPAGLFGVRHR